MIERLQSFFYSDFVLKVGVSYVDVFTLSQLLFRPRLSPGYCGTNTSAALR